MYWYPFSEKEENRAWEQAEAQASDTGSVESKVQMKFIGNLGELVIEQFLSEYADDRKWEYHHGEAMEKGEPEYGNVDFRVGSNSVDVKSSTDIRKLDPEEMYHAPAPDDQPHPLTVASEGYPQAKTNKADAFAFVLISEAQHDTPKEKKLRESIEETERDSATDYVAECLQERSGNYVATILGWIYSNEFSSEMMGNFNGEAKGKFTRMYLRDMYELLLRSNAANH